MARVTGIVMLLLLVTLTPNPVRAQTYQPGDVVRLVERDVHIPAHPAPGDRSVHLRFISGSTAMVLNIDDETGWIEVSGTSLTGQQNTGWISAKYIVGWNSDEEDASGTLDWCPPQGSPTPRVNGRLRIATWNLENLHARDGETTYTGDDPSVKRFATDYERIRCYVRLFDPDILAVQEVDGIEALSRVVDTEVYSVFVSTRPQSAAMNGKQNTGFAIRRGLTVQPQPDFKALDIRGDGTLRYGTRVDLTYNGQTIMLMSVHLKSGCFGNGSTSSACSTLMSQIPVLESWIDDAAEGALPFIILGDFNRRFNQPGDDVWADLDDGIPANADLTAVTQEMPISCRDNEFTEFIDHIVLDASAEEWVDQSSFRQVTYRQQDKEFWNKLSDHCPVVVELWIP